MFLGKRAANISLQILETSAIVSSKPPGRINTEIHQKRETLH